MRKLSFYCAVLLAGTVFSTLAARAEEAAPAYSAVLEGQVVLPAATFVQPPADAPADLKVSAKFTSADRTRNDKVGSEAGVSVLSAKEAPRTTGISLPFDGQAVQGFSGIVKDSDGTFLVITDNGFGSKANSPDAMLMIHRLAMDFKAGTIERRETVFLSDPDKKVPFPITMEGTPRRYLTGSDFDIESVQKVGDSLWFGDEFGPFLLETDLAGKVKGVYQTKADGKLVRSPDHPAVSTPANPSRKVAFEAARSKGFEGMALSPDKTKLYALLEGPLLDPASGEKEKVDGVEVLRILEFDLAKKDWTGRSWKYPLAQAGNAIGDFNMVDATTGLIIERDDLEGSRTQACAEGKVAPDCFDRPAKLKRVYKVEFTPETAGQLVRKIGYIDLLAIKDPNGKAKQGSKDGVLDFPFFTIEDVVMVDPTHIVVGNDNNLPYSAGRSPQKSDDNEFVLLDVGEFLKAK
ncbi:esterase-like activity of phytase family protein [Azorhizobium doebereinerae]|uniref:esterase-like activity of phytase family protein n=1 Tax=Azorhizobium doebereinerae TaxID=281091 RepID=UPI0004071E4D|nr:esterase-like activity of phytase family protein [Azorhizobium doebereinerae]